MFQGKVLINFTILSNISSFHWSSLCIYRINIFEYMFSVSQLKRKDIMFLSERIYISIRIGTLNICCAVQCSGLVNDFGHNLQDDFNFPNVEFLIYN